jgi:nucleoid-associated protein YgaU
MPEKKGLFGLFGGKKEEKEAPKAVEEKYKEMKKEKPAYDPEKAKADARAKADQVIAKSEHLQAIKDKKVIRKYVVVSGDTLSGIAKKYYDDAAKYMAIYEANKALIGDNPDLIKPGMELIIPDL